MADIEDKNPENVEGKFYVDEQCIDCDLCREQAPDNFQRDEDEGYSYVYKQPENDAELELCMEALEGCPVEAIGDNGQIVTINICSIWIVSYLNVWHNLKCST